MANLPVPNTMQVDVLFRLYNQIVENVYHVEAPDGVDAVALDDCKNMMAGWVTGNLMPLMSSDLVFTGLVVTNLSIEGGSQVTFEQVGGLPGSIGSAAEPGNVSYCISSRTDRIGRSYRGRKYIAGIPANKRTGNTIDATWAGQLVAEFNGLIDFLQTLNLFLVVVSRTLDNVERLVPVTTRVLNHTTTDLFIDSQRRRLTGRGT